MDQELFYHGPGLGNIASLFGKEYQSQGSSHRNAERLGTASTGKIIDNRLCPWVCRSPGQDSRLSRSKIPGQNQGWHWPCIYRLQPGVLFKCCEASEIF